MQSATSDLIVTMYREHFKLAYCTNNVIILTD